MEPFDHHSTTFAANWREIYRRMRGSAPVARSDAHGGFYAVTRHEDVVQVLRDADTFISGEGVTIPRNPFRMGIMEMDPPESVRLRRLVAPWFSPAAIDGFRPRIEEVVTWCIDRFVERGDLDIVDDLATPVPALVTLDLLGFPLDEWERYARVLHEAVYRRAGSAEEITWLLDDVNGIVAARRAEPGGVIEYLQRVGVEDTALPDELVVELAYMLLSGGNDTTTALISNVLLHLDVHPEDRARLLDDPALIAPAVEELIRVYTPATGVARTVRSPAEVAGERLEVGDRLLLALGSANLDETVFPDPERVDLDRQPYNHVAFGTGAHKCLGAALARVEMEVLLHHVLSRMPDYRVDAGRAERYPRMPLVNGYSTMPATFAAGRRVGPADPGDRPVIRSPRPQPPVGT